MLNTRRPSQLLGCDLSEAESVLRNERALGLSATGFVTHSRQKRRDVSDPERYFALPDGPGDSEFDGFQII